MAFDFKHLKAEEIYKFMEENKDNFNFVDWFTDK